MNGSKALGADADMTAPQSYNGIEGMKIRSFVSPYRVILRSPFCSFLCLFVTAPSLSMPPIRSYAPSDGRGPGSLRFLLKAVVRHSVFLVALVLVAGALPASAQGPSSSPVELSEVTPAAQNISPTASAAEPPQQEPVGTTRLPNIDTNPMPATSGTIGLSVETGEMLNRDGHFRFMAIASGAARKRGGIELRDQCGMGLPEMGQSLHRFSAGSGNAGRQSKPIEPEHGSQPHAISAISKHHLPQPGAGPEPGIRGGLLVRVAKRLRPRGRDNRSEIRIALGATWSPAEPFHTQRRDHSDAVFGQRAAGKRHADRGIRGHGTGCDQPKFLEPGSGHGECRV